MRRLLLPAAFAFLFPLSAVAFRPGEATVIIPVIGRFAGVPPSIWRTDVFIANPYGDTQVITLNFYVAGGTLRSSTVTMTPYSTLTLPDIVLNTFGLQAGSGQLELKTPGQFEARARIYNAGSAVGEYAQAVPGLGRSLLSRQVYLFGLSGINGNRVNVGLANTNDVATTGTLIVSDKNRNQLAYVTDVTIQAHETVQFNDIFARFNITPQADVQVEFNNALPGIYGYASVVRNDSGDPIFIFGTSPNA